MRTIFLLSAFSLSAFLLTGCSSSGGNKPTTAYPITRMLDPVTEDVPNVTVD